jgi:pimeloyl-ACP methyl ester carboxylesterase
VFTVTTVLAVVVSGLALLVYAGFLAARYFFVPGYPDEIHFARTTDGWRIAVYRYRPERPLESEPGSTNGAPPARAAPLLLVPGIGANHYNFDLTDETSLARYLSGRGWDVWVVELRGRGLSTRPRLFSGLRYDWSFDEYAERDLPAAAATVARVTGEPRLHLIGFSTGALASYAFLADSHRETEVASLVSIAGPATFRRAGTHVSGRVVRNLRWLRHRFLMRVLAPISGYWHPSPIQLIHNPENMEGEIQRRAMVNLIANFSRNELLQYGDWLLHDVFRSIDHRRDYRAELQRIEVPTLFLAGARDLLAPPDAVKEAFSAVSSRDKRFFILSRAQKASVNYGHFDMLLGPHARDDVYPVVAEWLAAHAGFPVAERERPQVAEAPAPTSAA